MTDLPQPTVPRPGKRKPAGYWKLVTAITGVAGAMVAIAGAGQASYDVAPFRIELRARPALAGQTELAIRPAGLNPGHAVAGTHAGPMAFRASITGVSGSLVPSDLRAIATPRDAAGYLGEEGKSAIRSFVLLCAMLALAGGAAGGTAVSFGRWQRVVGGALAGLIAFAVIGLVVQKTYRADEFLKSGRFARDDGAIVQPSDLPGTSPGDVTDGLTVVPTP